MALFLGIVSVSIAACGKLAGQGDDDDDLIGDDDLPNKRPDGGRADSGRPGKKPDASRPDADEENPYVEPECPNPPDPIYEFNCDPIAQDCAPDEACMGYVQYPSSRCDAEAYVTFCVPAGSGRQGDSCGGDGECAAGFWCLITGAGTTCAQTCDLAALDPCPDGRICVSTDLNGVGACL